jgi:hypothetical protein
MAATEGVTDAAVARRLISEVGTAPEVVQGLQGKDNLLARLPGFNQAAKLSPWLVLVDLDQDECAPALLRRWLSEPARLMCFRVVVRSVEAWLLADREGMAGFLEVAVSRIPRTPDELRNPKQDLINLARHSKRREIRSGIVPEPKTRRSTGKAYSLQLTDFVKDFWRPEIAARTSYSLRRCRERLRELIEGQT